MPLDKSAYQKKNLISQPKHMLWELKRTVSFEHPKHMLKRMDKKKIQFYAQNFYLNLWIGHFMLVSAHSDMIHVQALSFVMKNNL